MGNENAAPARGHQTPKSAALEHLPQEWRERLIAEARDMGIRSDHDTGWLLVGSVINAWACAAAAGRSAQAVEDHVKSIPDVIYQGASLAAEEVRKVVEGQGVTSGSNLAQKIEQAGTKIRTDILGIVQENLAAIHSAADGAAEKARQARDSIVQSGVQEYRTMAAQAIENAMAGYRVEKRKTAFLVGAFVVGMSFVLSCAFTVSLLQKMHYISPHPIQVTKSGHRNCGVANVGGFGPQYICVLDANLHPAPPVPQPQ